MRSSASCLLVLVLTGSCAEFAVRKVPQRGDYTGWDDTRQTQADAMDGLRFYMRRPFVAVHTPFPVSSECFLLNGQVSADGRWVSIDMSGASLDASGEAWKSVLKYVGWTRGGTAQIPAGGVIVRDALRASGPPAPGRAEGDAPEPDVADKAPRASGVGTFKVRTDLDDVSMIPFRKYFDVTHLPDHDEQYVIGADAQFGAVGVDITWGPGNSLLSMDATVDNSAIVAPLLDAYKKIVEAASTAVVSRINPVAAAESIVRAEGDAAPRTLDGGAPVTLIIHVVKFAAPGVYPILKPKEIHVHNSGRLNYSREPNTVVVGHPPAPCVAYGVYEEIFVEAATASPTARYIGPRFADEAGGRPMTPPNGDGRNKEAEKSADDILGDLRANHNPPGYEIISADPQADGSVRFRLKLNREQDRTTNEVLTNHLRQAWKTVTGKTVPIVHIDAGE